MTDNELIPSPDVQLVIDSNVPDYLNKIRPEWKSRDLIQRVNKLIKIDPSSACQRLLNAAMHDLKEKIKLSGQDIIKEATLQYKLPPITRLDDLENYSTLNIIHLSYRIGLLSHPEYRRILRCYEIRKDLEHEDSEYEAGVEDCLYIFKTCVDVVLSKDPIKILSVNDIKELIESPKFVTLNNTFLTDFEHAPQVRQIEILKNLININKDEKKPEIVRENAINGIFLLSQRMHPHAIIEVAKYFEEILGRKNMDFNLAKIALNAKLFPYLTKARKQDFFEDFFKLFESTGFEWGNFKKHGELLRNFQEVGGLEFVPDELQEKYVKWLILCYVGEVEVTDFMDPTKSFLQ